MVPAEHVMASHSRRQGGIASPKPGSAQKNAKHFSLKDAHPLPLPLKSVWTVAESKAKGVFIFFITRSLREVLGTFTKEAEKIRVLGSCI